MTPQQRDATIQHFMKNSNVTVFLISLKAGGVALVSRVHFLPLVSPADPAEPDRGEHGVHDGFVVEPVG
jgi:hypothetical protein